MKQISMAVLMLAIAGGASTASAQLGESNNSTESVLVGARYDDNINKLESDPALIRGARERAASRTPVQRAVAAKPSDMVVGAAVRDSAGEPIGTVASVGDEGVVVDTGSGQAAVPADAFGKTRQGLMLSITKAEFAKAVGGAAVQP